MPGTVALETVSGFEFVYRGSVCGALVGSACTLWWPVLCVCVCVYVGGGGGGGGGGGSVYRVIQLDHPSQPSLYSNIMKLSKVRKLASVFSTLSVRYSELAAKGWLYNQNLISGQYVCLLASIMDLEQTCDLCMLHLLLCILNCRKSVTFVFIQCLFVV